MFAKPYAVVVTTSASDLMGAVVLAATARAAGAAVETPLAHSQARRQIRRALSADARYVVILDGDAAEVLVTDGDRITTTATAAADLIADSYAAMLRTSIVSVDFRTPQIAARKAA